MNLALSDELALRLRALAGNQTKPDVPPELTGIELLVEAERFRRGAKDPVSDAYHPLALTQGSLVKDEYDLATHGTESAWTVGVVTADLRGTILFNARYGFPVGDAALRAMTGALSEQLPGTKVVRIRPAGFAALLLPSSGLTVVEEGLRERVSRSLTEKVRAVIPDDGEPPMKVELTIALLELQIVKPSHWQVLGPLIWAESDRAHVVERSGRGGGIQRRRIALDADLPFAHLGG